jgi:hypothetical protein
VNPLRTKTCAAACLLALAAAGAWAQSSCSSDGQPHPAGLLERFINADCESCWRAVNTSRPGRGELAVDWIDVGSRGDDAPLSAVALRETGDRLEALGLAKPLQDNASRHKAQSGAHRLRVAQGPPFGGYIGASIELKPGRGGPWQAWLLLVEALPAGTEGSAVERQLVRNALQLTWDRRALRTAVRPGSYYESRAMSIPPGANPARLRVVGWVEDARGRIREIAQSRCVTSPQ